MSEAPKIAIDHEATLPAPAPGARRLVLVLLLLMMAAVGGAAATGLAMIVIDTDDAFMSRMLALGLLAALHFAFMLGAAWVICCGRLISLMWLVFPTASIGLALGAVMLWRVGDDDWDDDFRSLLMVIQGSADLIAITLVHTGLLTGVTTRGQALTAVKWCVAALGWLVAIGLGVLIWLLWFESVVEGLYAQALLEGAGIAAGTGAGLVVLGTLGVRIAARVHARRIASRAETMSRSFTISMTCPRCAAPQTFAPGLARCGACRFTMMIELQEPRCECGYLLYRLDADTCPECGRAVPRRVAAAERPAETIA